MVMTMVIMTVVMIMILVLKVASGTVHMRFRSIRRLCHGAKSTSPGCVAV